MGPFDSRDDADKARAKLEATGLEVALVRVQR
jgi:cell division protein FtsN